MIISFHHQFIFVAIPKTASHTFRVALRPHLGAIDWEQCNLFETKTFPLEPLAKFQHGHFTYNQVQPFLLPGMWERSFTFCTVRNPYDRFVSHVYFRQRDDHVFQQDPLGFMKRVMEAPAFPFIPQSEYILNPDGLLMVDYVARLENLQADFDHICQQIGLPTTQLQHINPAIRPLYHEVLDEELTQMLQHYYAEDFAMFGYPLEYGLQPNANKAA